MYSKTVIVIGLGPAGLLAAGRAAELGACVIAIERNPTAGRKLLLTGKGRCNLTNTAELKEFIEAFGQKGKFLYGAFYQFFRDDLLALLKRYDVSTVVERGGRIFPASQKSSTVVQAFLQYTAEAGVKVQYGKRVEKVAIEHGNVTGVRVAGRLIAADAVIVTTGGRSYPKVGSTGDGYEIARQAGHTVINQFPALVPLEVKEKWVQELQGLGLRNVELTLHIDGQQLEHKFGEMLFTHFGMSGPIVLDLSRDVVSLVRQYGASIFTEGRLTIRLNLKPAMSHEEVRSRLQREFEEGSKKYFATILKELLPSSFIPVMISLSGISRGVLGHRIGKAEREKLIRLFTDLPMTVTGLRSWHEAVITSGGVALDEVNPKTMESKLVKRLYFAGEILDLDAKTGGYNLQEAFSTGWVAGEHAASASAKQKRPS